MSPLISVIVPFCLRQGDDHCITRLMNAVDCFSDQSGIEVNVFDTSLHPVPMLADRLSEKVGVLYEHQTINGVFSPGQTRNHAVKKAEGQYLFFCDADLLCSDYFVKSLTNHAHELANSGLQAFAMFPCLYLSEQATQHIVDNKPTDYSPYWLSFFKGEIDQVDGIAVVSSCLLVSRDWFNTLGGFKADFVGHGYEDFELIHRLASYYLIGQLPDDYAEDVKSPFPADYKGFRRYLSYYALPHLFNHYYLLHQWHVRPLANRYHRQRKNNKRMFADIISDNAPQKTFPAVDKKLPCTSHIKLPVYREWILHLMQRNKLSLDDYPGLFRWKAGVVRPSNGFSRKLRKLFLNPGQFFRDMI